jgi:transcriptional regulator with AAA-type ATPase domain
VRPRPEKNVPPGLWLPRQSAGNQLVAVTLSEYSSLDNLRDTLFGWAERSWNLAYEAYDGLLGEAHNGTLFLDEIHHLDRSLQASLLGPLNNRRYRPKMAIYELATQFDLVVATNDPEWRDRLADDFRDRIERIVLEVPSFRSFQRTGVEVLWSFWEWTVRQRCRECAITYTQEGDWENCGEELRSVLRRHPLPGNWRDLQRLADNLLLVLVSGRDGQVPQLIWSKDQLEVAIYETFGNN